MNKNHVQQLIYGSTLRLMLTFLAIIMAMSMAFSLMIYGISAHQLEMQRPFEIHQKQTNDGSRPVLELVETEPPAVFREHVNDSKQELARGLMVLNLGVLLVGLAVSYVLARAALRPIEQNMEAQSQFVSDVSHELRTPLTALKTTSEVALRKKKLTLGEARETIAYAVEESARLQDLTAGLLALVKSDNKVITTPVSVQQAVSQSLTTVAPLAVAKSITIQDESTPLFVAATPTGLEQLLTILLDNAIKYSGKNSTVTITSQKRGATVQLAVRDQGDGIDATTQQHIFDRFYRADKARTKQQTTGYGLGLAIANRLVDSFGGSIRVKSKVGEGSTFTLILPAAKHDDM